MDPTDSALLERYAQANDQAAFAELVRRHLNLVYSVARRQVRSRELAEEVAQSVFADLAVQVRRSPLRAPLGAWLYVVARRSGIDAVRRESRRQARDQAAFELSAMNTLSPTWPRIEPLLDEAMAALPDLDRGALILRYLENRSLREVGAALGTSENAAQKRISRGLEQLRGSLARRGVAVSAGVLATDLAVHSLEAAPAALYGAIAAATGASGAAALTVTTLAMTTAQKALLTTAAALVLALGAYQASLNNGLRADLQRQVAALRESRDREQRLRGERDELLRRQAETAQAAQAVIMRPAEPPAGPAPAPEPSRANAGPVQILQDSNTLADGFVQELALTEPEQARVLAALQQSRDKLTELGVSHATLTNQPDGTVLIAIAPFAEGQAIYDDLMTALGEALGNERMGTFREVYHGDALGLVLGNFGAGPRTIRVTRVPPNYTGLLPGGVRLAPTNAGGFMVMDSVRTPNAYGMDSVGLLQDVASRAILKPFAERLNAMALYQGAP